MTIDREEFARVSQSQHKGRSKTSPLALKQMSVRQTALVGTPEWDSYLSMLEAMVSDVSGIREKAREQLESPAVLKPDELIKAKMLLRESCAMLQVLEYVIALPYHIIHSAADADAPKFPLPEVPDFVERCK